MLASLNIRRPISLGRKVNLKFRDDLIYLKKKKNKPKTNSKSTAVKTGLSGQTEDRKTLHGRGSLARLHRRWLSQYIDRDETDGMKCHRDPRASQAGGD